jgi:hypothetical protein
MLTVNVCPPSDRGDGGVSADALLFNARRHRLAVADDAPAQKTAAVASPSGQLESYSRRQGNLRFNLFGERFM